MRIDVTTAGLVLTSTLRGNVRRQVRLTMSRFGPEVHRVSARLAESRNPLGGLDRCCSVRARLRSGRVLSAEAINGLIEAAVGRCVAHVALLVANELDDGGGGSPLTLALRRRRRVGAPGLEPR